MRAALLIRNSDLVTCHDIRKLFYPGQQPRCACVRDTGAPSTDPAARLDRGNTSTRDKHTVAGKGSTN